MNEHPVLIVGNQKAGTSAIAGLLAEATGTTVTIDLLGELIEPALPDVARGTLSFEDFVARNRSDFSRDIIKDCHLTFHLADLRHRFPGSPIIFIVRDPRTNIRSLMDRWGVFGTSPDLPPEVKGELGPGWRRVLDGIDLAEPGPTDLDRLAQRWKAMSQIYLSRADDLVLARYEDFLNDKVGFISKLARQVELETVNDITPHVDRQFQPRGSRQSDLVEFFGAVNLARIEDLCEPEMTLLGYSPSAPTTGSEPITDR